MTATTSLLEELNDFDPTVRAQALRLLAECTPATTARSENVNMHLHTFFSYNAEGWSPSRVAWECRRHGLTAAGIIDFDVLDGLEEFFQAGELLGLRTCVGVETRTYYPEFAQYEIDSPGEPGVHYLDGIGFTTMPRPGTPQAETLALYRLYAQERNAALIARINPHVPEIALDYDTDVVPLSPGRCPTERHIIAAYVNKAQAVLNGPTLVAFWAVILGVSDDVATRLLADRPSLEEKVRAKLAKRGGLGYEQPTSKSFPLLEDFYAWVKSCDAIPMESWLDGTSDGEQRAQELLECTMARGARAINIIPDRNWNIADPAMQAIKVANLRRIVELANTFHLPINIGTEMNKLGLPFADDLQGPILREFKETFRRGALVMVGHCLCARFAGFSYASEAADAEFPTTAAKNAFFAAVGELPAATQPLTTRFRAVGCERAYALIRDAAATGHWPQ